MTELPSLQQQARRLIVRLNQALEKCETAEVELLWILSFDPEGDGLAQVSGTTLQTQLDRLTSEFNQLQVPSLFDTKENVLLEIEQRNG